MVIGFGSGVENARLVKPRLLIQMWVASSKITDEDEEYTELTTQNRPFYIISDDGGGLASYRMHSLSHTITIQQDEEDEEDEEDDDINNSLEHQKPEGVISRVFRNNKPEISPNISYYSLHEYPHRDFALSCGIRSSLCIPFFESDDGFPGLPEPDGVLEIVSTCDVHVFDFAALCRGYDAFFFRGIKMYFLRDLIYGFSRLQPMVEIENLLTLVCQTFPVPLAQCWVIKHTARGALKMVYRRENGDFENVEPWSKFKRACSLMGLNIGEGPVGKSYLSHKSYLCRDITELSITDYPLAHYASECGSTACFTICLCSFTTGYRECVLEFFLPSRETNSIYAPTLLNSLLQTMKEHLPSYMVASGEVLGQVLSVEVIKSSTHDEPEYIQIGQPQSSLPHHEEPENERGASDQLPHSLQLLSRDAIVPDHVEEIEDLPVEDVASANEEDISFESLSKHFGRPLDDAAKTFGVSRSTFKRICRGHGIKRWQSGKRRMKNNTSFKLGEGLNDGKSSRSHFSSPVHDTVVAHTSQELMKLIVKATYVDVTIRFELPDLSSFADLEENVIERLHLERSSFSIKYQDDEGDWVLIACDKDVRECTKISRLLKKTTIKMLIDLPTPVHFCLSIF